MKLHEQWGISRTDTPQQIAAKIRSAIHAAAPDLTEAQQADQALLAWNGIRAEWAWPAAKNPLAKADFRAAWGSSANGALDRQAKRQGWGGHRPGAGSGGARPRTGPLKQSITLAPFSHGTKGATISSAEVEVSRCNYCGATGWRYVMPECLFAPDAAEDERITVLPGTTERPLLHTDGCIMK